MPTLGTEVGSGSEAQSTCLLWESQKDQAPVAHSGDQFDLTLTLAPLYYSSQILTLVPCNHFPM